jgi:tRNA(Arg) A34 adenosine deaminase TadA
MRSLIQLAKEHSTPYAALILDANGFLISKEANKVGELHDASAHAEIMAIREAGKYLGTPDLKGCRIITTCEPCPMCTSAIFWSNISEIVYGLSIPGITELGQPQMPQRSCDLLLDAGSETRIYGGLMANEVSALFT